MSKYKVNKIIYGIGILSISKLLFSIGAKFYKYFLSKMITNNDFKTKYGDGYVIVTGEANELIEKYIEYLYINNHKILLLSQNSNLRELYDKIKYRLKADDSLFKHINWEKEKVNEYFSNASILLLNPYTSVTDYLDQINESNVKNIVENNVLNLTYIIQKAIFYMKERKKSLIVCLGTSASLWLPGKKSLYIGSMMYLEGLIGCLINENTNIDFTYLQTGPIVNIGEDFISKIPLKISSSECLSSSLSIIGRYRKSFCHYKHELLYTIYGTTILGKYILFNKINHTKTNI